MAKHRRMRCRFFRDAKGRFTRESRCIPAKARKGLRGRALVKRGRAKPRKRRPGKGHVIGLFFEG